jgi:hypothetical protein
MSDAIESVIAIDRSFLDTPYAMGKTGQNGPDGTPQSGPGMDCRALYRKPVKMAGLAKKIVRSGDVSDLGNVRLIIDESVAMGIYKPPSYQPVRGDSVLYADPAKAPNYTMPPGTGTMAGKKVSVVHIAARVLKPRGAANWPKGRVIEATPPKVTRDGYIDKKSLVIIGFIHPNWPADVAEKPMVDPEPPPPPEPPVDWKAKYTELLTGVRALPGITSGE